MAARGDDLLGGRGQTEAPVHATGEVGVGPTQVAADPFKGCEIVETGKSWVLVKGWVVFVQPGDYVISCETALIENRLEKTKVILDVKHNLNFLPSSYPLVR